MAEPKADPTALTTDALEREVARSNERTDEKVKAVRDYMDVKFTNIDNWFVAVEAARQEQKADTEKQVAAALSAAKEAVKEQTIASDRAISKSESQTKERYDNIDKSVDELKAKVGAIEASKQGGTDMRVLIFAIVGMVITVILAANGMFK